MVRHGWYQESRERQEGRGRRPRQAGDGQGDGEQKRRGQRRCAASEGQGRGDSRQGSARRSPLGKGYLMATVGVAALQLSALFRNGAAVPLVWIIGVIL